MAEIPTSQNSRKTGNDGVSKSERSVRKVWVPARGCPPPNSAKPPGPSRCPAAEGWWVNRTVRDVKACRFTRLQSGRSQTVLGLRDTSGSFSICILLAFWEIDWLDFAPWLWNWIKAIPNNSWQKQGTRNAKICKSRLATRSEGRAKKANNQSFFAYTLKYSSEPYPEGLLLRAKASDQQSQCRH